MALSLRSGLLAFLILANVPVHAASENFMMEVSQHHLLFSVPDNFTETPVIPNNDLKYDYAVKSGSSEFEIRYLLKPDSHVGLKTFVPAMAMNIAGTGNLKSVKRFDPQEANAEFGADEGLYAVIEGMDSEFGQGYRNCIFLAIQKEGSGQAYIFFLFNDSKDTDDLLKSSFHSLKFGETSGP